MEASHLGHWNASNALLIGTLSLHPLGHFTTAGIFGFQNQVDQGREFSGKFAWVASVFRPLFSGAAARRRRIVFCKTADVMFEKPPIGFLLNRVSIGPRVKSNTLRKPNVSIASAGRYHRGLTNVLVNRNVIAKCIGVSPQNFILRAETLEAIKSLFLF